MLAWEIQRACGLKEFGEAEGELRGWVAARAKAIGDGPKAIFHDAVRWLRERDVLLPGVTTLARLVASVREGPTRWNPSAHRPRQAPASGAGRC